MQAAATVVPTVEHITEMKLGKQAEVVQLRDQSMRKDTSITMDIR